MKSKLKTFFNTPNHVAIVSLVLALVVGIIGYQKITRAPSYTFTQAKAGTIYESNGIPSIRDLTLGFVSGGRIATVNVKAGDTVTKGQVLASLDTGTASGALEQAQAAYDVAQANYQKVINGATGTAIDVAKAALNTAETNLTEATKQQDVLVQNAYRNLLNSTLTAEADNGLNSGAPLISGTYTKNKEGSLIISVNQSSSGGFFSLSGLDSGTGIVSTTKPEPLGDTGLFVVFPTTQTSATNWHIDIPNTKAVNYLSNYNAYQQALQTKSQTLASLTAAVSQAEANLAQVASVARPEDVATAKAQVENAAGALQIAQAAYANIVITAPGDGTVIAVSISPGQIATPNNPAIEVRASTTEKNVAVMIPKNALFEKNGVMYVLKKSGSSTEEVHVTLGIADDTNVEILEGVTSGDMVVTH